MTITKTLILALALTWSIVVTAASPLPYKVCGLGKDTHISGPTLTEDDLAGKVILVEEFGFRCPPCIASLPHMQKVYEKFSKTGKFLLVGAHYQGFDKAAIQAILTKGGVEYPTYQGFSVSGKPSAQGIPFAYLVNHQGKVLWSGHPNALDQGAISKAIKVAPDRIPGSLIPGITLKYHKGVLKQLIEGKNCDSVLNRLSRISQQSTPAGQEAKMIVDTCEKWFTDKAATITAEIEKTPAKAYYSLQLLMKTSPKHALAFKDAYTKLKETPYVTHLATFYPHINKLRQLDLASPTKRRAATRMAKGIKMRLSAFTQNIEGAIKDEAQKLHQILDKQITDNQ